MIPRQIERSTNLPSNERMLFVPRRVREPLPEPASPTRDLSRDNDFNRRIERETANTKHSSGVCSPFAQDLMKQVGSAVENLGMLLETRDRLQVTFQSREANDRIERNQDFSYVCESVDCA